MLSNSPDASLCLFLSIHLLSFYIQRKEKAVFFCLFPGKQDSLNKTGFLYYENYCPDRRLRANICSSLIHHTGTDLSYRQQTQYQKHLYNLIDPIQQPCNKSCLLVEVIKFRRGGVSGVWIEFEGVLEAVGSRGVKLNSIIL